MKKSITSALVLLGPLSACEHVYVYPCVCLRERVCAHACGQMCRVWPQVCWCLYLYVHVPFYSGECMDITVVGEFKCSGTRVHARRVYGLRISINVHARAHVWVSARI